MPQATGEARARYIARFGDIGCEHAVAELKRRGYTLGDDWSWQLYRMDEPTEEEEFWIYFLMAEWDFGGMAQPKEESRG